MMRERVHMTRRWAAVLAVSMALALLSGCGDEHEPATFGDGPQFSIAVMEEPDSLNPLVAESKLSEEFMLLVYDPLWRIDANGEPVNCLVDDYSLSSDQRTLTVRLRQDVTFSDGEPLTSADVQYSYQTMSLHSDVYAPYCAGISDIRCPDERTVVFTTSYVKGDMLYCPIPILPKHIWNRESNVRSFANEEMIGSGPFVREMTDVDPQEISWTFRTRENYFGGPAKIGSLRYIWYGTETGGARALSTGEVDAAIELTDVQLTTLEGVPGVELIQALLKPSDVWVLAFNTRKGVFSRTPMRQMVENCLDRSWLLSMSSGETGWAGSVFASPAEDYFYTITNPRTQDWDYARTVIYTDGFDDIDDDGAVEDLMTRDELVLSLYTSSRDDWAPTAATVLKDNIESVGIRVQWNTTDGKVEDICTAKGDWDMCLITWRGNVNPVIAADRLRARQNSLTGWENQTYEDTLQRLREASDRAAAITTAGQLQQIAYDDCPYMILAYRSDIQGIRADRWTGYQDVLGAASGVFRIGSVDGYMTLEPLEEAES